MNPIVRSAVLSVTIGVLFLVGLAGSLADTYFDTHGKTLSNTATSSACAGEIFTLTQPANITTIYRYSTSTASSWFLYNGTKVADSENVCGGTPLASGTFASGQLSATVLSGNGLVLNAQQNYTILTSGSSYTMQYGGSADNPVAGNTSLVQWVGGVSDVSQDAYIRNVWGIGFNPVMASSSTYVDGHGKTLSNSATSSACAGEVFNLTNTSLLIHVYRYSTDTAAFWYVYNGSKLADTASNCGGTPLATGKFDDGHLDDAVLIGGGRGIVLNRNQNYTLLTQGMNYQMKYGGSSDNPVVGNTSIVQWIRGVSGLTADGYIRNVHAVGFVVGGVPGNRDAALTDSHNRALPNTSTSSACAGLVFNLTNTINITVVLRQSNTSGTAWFLYNGTKVADYLKVCGGTPLATGGFADGQLTGAVFGGENDGVVLNRGQNYTLLISGTGYQMRYGANNDTPVLGNTSIVQWIRGVSDTTQDGYVRNVKGIGFYVVPNVDTHGKALENSASSSACAGEVFNLTTRINLTRVHRASADTATSWYLYNGTKVADSETVCGGTPLASGTFSGGDLSTSVQNGEGIVLNAQQNYTLLTSGSNYQMRYGASNDNPVMGTTSIVHWIGGVSDVSQDGYIRNIQSLEFQMAP